MRTSVLCAVALAICGVASFAPSVEAAGDPVKELTTLEDDFETTELDWLQAYEAFRPKYAALAKKYAGTEQALTAKLRLLQFTGQYKGDDAKVNAAAAKLFDEILAEYPKSEQLEKVPGWYYLFAKAKFAEVKKALSAPDRPEKVQAAVALAEERFDDILAKWKDVPCRWSTYGEIADAMKNPHPKSALEVGQPAPEIVGKSIDGKIIKLSDLKGRVVVLDFFGDW